MPIYRCTVCGVSIYREYDPIADMPEVILCDPIRELPLLRQMQASIERLDVIYDRMEPFDLEAAVNAQADAFEARLDAARYRAELDRE